MAPKTPTDQPFTERVLFSTLVPMARLATRLQLPLRRVKQLAELAYYQEARQRGLKMAEIQEVMSVGFSKVGTMSRQLKDYHGALGSDFSLQRRILLLLWAVPLTEKHLIGAFPDSEPHEVQEALREMVQQGRLKVIPGRTERFELVAQHNQLLQDHWFARLGALDSLLSSVIQVVEARFFGRGQEAAFVRTLNFRARPQDLWKLEKFYRESLFALVQELDEAATPDQASVPIKLSWLWVRDEDIETDDIRARDHAGDSAEDTPDERSQER